MLQLSVCVFVYVFAVFLQKRQRSHPTEYKCATVSYDYHILSHP